jgi:hypothetical protein
MSNKENWIEDTLELASIVRKVEVPEKLTENVLKKLPTTEKGIVSLQPYTQWMIAASIALLIGLNSFTFIKFAERGNRFSSENQGNTIYTAYFSFIN